MHLQKKKSCILFHPLFFANNVMFTCLSLTQFSQRYEILSRFFDLVLDIMSNNNPGRAKN